MILPDNREMAHGRVVQINVSRGGVPKLPVAEAVVTPLGLEGDACAHPQIHGGRRQALLVIAREAVDAMAAAGYPVSYGSLGENLTVEGIDHRQWRAGQRYRVGAEVIIELTKPRVPCRALDVYGAGLKKQIYDERVKAGDVASPVWGMSGFYAAVVSGGRIARGAPVVLVDEMA